MLDDDIETMAELANKEGKVITVYRDGRPWVDIVPREAGDAQRDYLAAGVETMVEYREMFEELA